jgi:hypothetical protein
MSPRGPKPLPEAPVPAGGTPQENQARPTPFGCRDWNCCTEQNDWDTPEVHMTKPTIAALSSISIANYREVAHIPLYRWS